MECPNETTLSSFLAGFLSDERRAEVLEHILRCPECERVLAAGRSSGPSGPALEEEAPLARNSTIGRYVVLAWLGQGAMGVVYAAYDPELDRQIALKLLRARSQEAHELRQRLLREAQSLARLSHANVVAIYDVGTCEEGVFLALELVEGATLAGWLEQPHSWQEVLHVFQEAGHGLAAAHAAGLVHRDVKPTNILVGNDGRARITDFGLAGPPNRDNTAVPPTADGTATGDLSTDPLTRSGALVGTPAYMAPETLRGQRADALSDQFSFCVALYEALFGVRPFTGNNPEDRLRAMREERVQPPSTRGTVPAKVRRAILKGLRYRPADRHASMEELLSALQPRSRRVLPWLAAALAVPLLFVLVNGTLTRRREVHCQREVDRLAEAWSPEHHQRVKEALLGTGKPYAAAVWEKVSTALDAHVTQWRTLRMETCLAAEAGENPSAWQTTTCLDTRLWQLSATVEVLERADEQILEKASQMVGAIEGLTVCRDAPALSTRPQPPDALRPRVDAVRRRLAEVRVQTEAGRHPEALATTSALLEEVRTLDFQPLEAEVLLEHGQLHGLTGKHQEAEEILYRALWAAEASRDDEVVVRTWSLLVWLIGDQLARADEVDRLTRHARAALERLGSERAPTITTELHLRLGSMLVVQGRLEDAERELTKGLELARKLQGPESLLAARFLSPMGRIRSQQIRNVEALELFREAQQIRERLLGQEHPGLAVYLSNTAVALINLGRREEAIEAWRRSLRLQEVAHTPDHPSLAGPLNNLGVALRKEGKLEEARGYLDRALAIMERSKGKDHPDTMLVLCALGQWAMDAQQPEEALKWFERALKSVQGALGPETPRAALPLAYRGLLHLRANRLREARSDLLRSLELSEQVRGKKGASGSSTLRVLAEVELASRNPKLALEYCQKALALDEAAQGPAAPDVALDFICQAEVLLTSREPQRAIPLIEKAREIHRQAPRDRSDAAWATFMLARALAEQNPSEPERANALAAEARVELETLGARGHRKLKAVSDWQRQRGTP
ncbi:serine/threonine-protein kinase [Archangium lansingense]|uniref:Tetratricopeptide repeat-containing serine/threonine protein kinase n=1 Tax=Archangium lansingense TaxID=2995310 RepID=A0ABT4A7H1_9BACT|nr:serine/threonine-protein kinase [Archangium lansinium]MCY1077560.1 tetratricopeptide repeat-containing serine/threonine protein kinase [Archangium lansinium]